MAGGIENLGQKYRYNGKELQEETGWLDYGARMYDAQIGRWHVIDPMSETMNSWSAYNYTFNNPVNLVDINGLFPEIPPGGGYYAASVNTRTIGFGTRHPVAASRIGLGVTRGAINISTNATRFATRGNVLDGSTKEQIDEGSENGAFRHTLWQASITSEFGRSTVAQAGNTHEKNPFTDLSEKQFSDMSEADQTVDLLNNRIGRDIGESNKGANMKELAFKVLNEFKEDGLFTASENSNGT